MKERDYDKEILNCPCCSYSACLETMMVRKGWEANIHCNGCGLEIQTITFDFKEEAIEDAMNIWNKRPTKTIIDELSKIKGYYGYFGSEECEYVPYESTIKIVEDCINGKIC